MYILKVKKTNILYPFTQFYAPDSYKYKQKSKRGEKKGQVHEDRTHLLYKRIIFDIRRRKKKRRDKVISTRNSFSYENISIKFSMYQVHTKSIKVCRISNMIQYKVKEKEKKKNNILLYYKVS